MSVVPFWFETSTAYVPGLKMRYEGQAAPDAPVYIVQTLSGTIAEIAVSLEGMPPQRTPWTEPFEICTSVSWPEKPCPMIVSLPPVETVAGEMVLIKMADAAGAGVLDGVEPFAEVGDE